MIEPIVMFTATAMMLAGLGLASAMVWYVQDRAANSPSWSPPG